MDVINASNTFWGSIIEKMNFDCLKKKVEIEVTLIEDGIQTNHILEFRDYDSLFWLEKPKTLNENYDVTKCDYYELTSIIFRNIQANTNDKWLKQYSLNYNVAIEIWESALLIRTNIIIIDGIEYLLDTKE